MPEKKPSKLKIRQIPTTRASKGKVNFFNRHVQGIRRFLRLLILFLLLAGGLYWIKIDRSWSECWMLVENVFQESVGKLSLLKDSLTNRIDADNAKHVMRLPANGTEYTHFISPGVAPFTVYNRSTELHCIVKMEDYKTGRPIAKYFVRAGQKIEKELPLGQFKLKFATGKDWYGEPYLFGSKTEAVEMTPAITVTMKNGYIWISAAEVEININIQKWSSGRKQSKPLNVNAW